MTEIEKAWLAGFIDGEGCISLAKINLKQEYGAWIPTLYITNTNLPVLKYIQKLIGEKGFLNKGYKSTPRAKLCYRIVYQSHSVRRILTTLLPFLRIKHKVAEVILNFPKRRSISLGYGKGTVPDVKGYKKQLEYVKLVRKLNKRGT